MTRATGNPVGRPRKYRFGELAVGGSFLVALRHMGHRTSVASAAHHFARRYGGKFRTELVSVGGGTKPASCEAKANAVRVTRIA